MEAVRFKHIFNVFIGDYPFADKLKNEILSVLESYPDKQDRKTNVKAVMSEWDIRSSQIDRFKKYVLNELDKKDPVYAVHDLENSCVEPVFADFWANIYSKGDYAISHQHKPARWSIVYFLKTKWYHSSLVFPMSHKKIRPKEGRFVLFPAHLEHAVPKHRFDDQRITLAGNIEYVYRSDKFQIIYNG